MPFGSTPSRRRAAAQAHTQREHTCRCGRRIRGNAYYRHRAACRNKPFRVIEHCNGFEVEHIASGRTHWLSDGVDVLPGIQPGHPQFRARWERELNESESETLEAYFPEDET